MRQTDIFLELIRLGLWKEAEYKPFEIQPNWKTILKIAKEQSMIAIVFDGIKKISKSFMPQKRELLQWYALVVCIENSNEQHDKDLCSLTAYCQSKNIDYRLMKGQGCASFYPQPNHRQCGDIDLFVGEEQYNIAKHAIIQANITIEKEGICDAHFLWGETQIELHKIEAFFYDKSINSNLQTIFRKEEWLEPQAIEVGNQQIQLFNPTFNVFYIFIHLYHHFLQIGIGLRQICDWMLIMKSLEEKIDWDRIHEYLKSIECISAWKAFYGLTVEYMGQHLNNVPVWMSEYSKDDVQFVLKDIMSVGNFGKYGSSFQKRSFNGGLLANVSSFMSLTKRLITVSRFGYKETIAYPMWKLFNDKMMLNRYKKQ